MVEEYQQAVSVANLGGIRDVQGLYTQLGLKSSPQVLKMFGSMSSTLLFPNAPVDFVSC